MATGVRVLPARVGELGRVGRSAVGVRAREGTDVLLPTHPVGEGRLD